METKIKSNAKMSFSLTLELTEEEARALKELTVYGTDSFLEFFYKNLGKSYLMPHEAGLRSLFETIKKELPPQLNQITWIRDCWKKRNE